MSLPENNVNYCDNYFSANQAQELVLVEQHPQGQICNVDEAGLYPNMSKNVPPFQWVFAISGFVQVLHSKLNTSTDLD